MLQALIALALVIAILPTLTKKISLQNIQNENSVTASQISSVWAATHNFIYENGSELPDGITKLSGDKLTQTLEPFGLPLGFIPKTPTNHTISVIISKDRDDIFTAISASGAKISEMRRAEILSRIGFWGIIVNDDKTISGSTGGWKISNIPNDLKLSPDDILVRVPNDEEFSELIIKNSKNPNANIFHTDLGMSNNDIKNIGTLSSSNGKIKNIAAGDFFISGNPDRKNRNDVGEIKTSTALFSSTDGNPLTITKSDLKTGIFWAESIANFGDLPMLVTDKIFVHDFNMASERTDFNGPGTWDVSGDASFTNVSVSVERLGISSFLDASSPDIFGSTTSVGIQTDVLKTGSIILRDQISSELLSGKTASALLEIRPAGVSILPDVLLSSINNDSIKIPSEASDNNGKTETCRSIITKMGKTYDESSLTDNIICQFVMYNRIEHRINIKECLLNGRTDCQ